MRAVAREQIQANQHLRPKPLLPARARGHKTRLQERFGPKMLVSLYLLARNGSHGFAFVDQQPSQPGGVFLLQDHREDRYRSATASFHQVFSESTEIYGPYTRSRAHSNEVLSPSPVSM